MTVTSTKDARDDILALFRVAWEAGATAVAGYVPVVRWEDLETVKPPTERAWARARVLFNIEEQSSLGEVGGRKFETRGLFNVDIFSPLKDPSSEIDDLADVVKSAYRGKRTASGIWFRDVRVADQSPEPPWRRIRVLGEFVAESIQ